MWPPSLSQKPCHGDSRVSVAVQSLCAHSLLLPKSFSMRVSHPALRSSSMISSTVNATFSHHWAVHLNNLSQIG
eukprot:6035278-Amphidinium_carterae.1